MNATRALVRIASSSHIAYQARSIINPNRHMDSTAAAMRRPSRPRRETPRLQWTASLGPGYFFQSPCRLHSALAETLVALVIKTASGFASTSRD
jgi:hypothetical protein